MTGEVQLDQSGLRVRGEFVPLIAGELEFWRHNPDDWPKLLLAVRETGVRLVSTFLCWDFHEVEEGEFDFDGHTNPMRDLERFLGLASEAGLLVNLRPGPIIDSEWPTRGPAPDVAALERSEPRFRERAASWLAAVGELIARHQLDAGGPVVLVQLDNEVFYPHVTELSATEADSAFHIPYREEQVLTDLAVWQEAAGEEGLPARTVPFTLLTESQRLAAFRFLRDQVLDYLTWVEGELKAAGVTVPCYTNTKQSCAYLDVAATSKHLSGGASCNNYLDRLHTLDEILVAVWWGGVVRATSNFPWAPEYWCGRWIEEGQDTSVFDPKHYQFCLLTHLALGLRGLNYFSLVERDDWHYSPITAIGRVREPLAAPIAVANRVLTELRADRRRADVALVWSLTDHQLELARRGFDWTELSSIWWEMDEPKERVEWWETLRSLVEADVDFSIVNQDDPRLSDFPYIIAPANQLEGGAFKVSADAQILPLAGRHTAQILSESGATSHISASETGVWTALYDADDGLRSYGFVVNFRPELVRTDLRSPHDLRNGTWIHPPVRQNDENNAIELQPRSVAVLLLSPDTPTS